MTPHQHLLSCDPILAAVVERVGPLDERNDLESHFHSLCRIIVGQQLSVAVARSIWNRVQAHFGSDFTPEVVAKMTVDAGKSLGLSKMKAIYLQSLATHILEGHLAIDRLETLDEAEIVREITAVKGLGPWSADIFMMFHLGRGDILPVGDLGVREAIKRLYNLEERPDAAQMEEISQPWRPHRTLASRYLWRALDNTPGS